MIRNLLIIQLFLWNVFVTFAQPACPTIQMSGSDVSCYGASDGSATVAIISGGSGSYQYSWSDGTPASGLSSTISPRPAGTYTVTVHDLGSGCSVVGAYVIGSPDPILRQPADR